MEIKLEVQDAILGSHAHQDKNNLLDFKVILDLLELELTQEDMQNGLQLDKRSDG